MAVQLVDKVQAKEQVVGYHLEQWHLESSSTVDNIEFWYVCVWECLGKIQSAVGQQYHPTFLAAYILDKVFIQASSLACEVYVEVSLLCSLPTTVCEVKVCLISIILGY